MSQHLDKDAFLKLIQANQGILFKICHSNCKNKNDREDLAQEIVFELWMGAGLFSDSKQQLRSTHNSNF